MGFINNDVHAVLLMCQPPSCTFLSFFGQVPEYVLS